MFSIKNPISLVLKTSFNLHLSSNNQLTKNISKKIKPLLTSNVSNYSSNNLSIDPTQEQLFKENCLLVDENDKVIGHASKKDCHTLTDDVIPLHRAFSVFLFNENNELLIQQRSRCKITYPEYFTNTCCSHPLYDHKDEAKEKNNIGIKLAAKRRLNYELGILEKDIDPEKDIKCITKIHYFDKGDGVYGEHEIDYVLFIRKNINLNINKNEVNLIQYFNMDQLKIFLRDLHYPITPWFHLILEHKLYDWWSDLDNLINKKQDENNIDIIKF